MYLDEARKKDLAKLHSQFTDFSFPIHHRKGAYRAYRRIQDQANDRQLALMRMRLINASRNNDKYEMWKISNQIKDYMHEDRIEQAEKYR